MLMVLSLVAMCKCGGVYIGRCAEEEEERWRVECCWDCSFAPSSFLPTYRKWRSEDCETGISPTSSSCSLIANAHTHTMR